MERLFEHFDEDKADALAQYTGCSIEDIEEVDHNEHIYSCPDGEFRILTDDEADEAFYDYSRALFDDCGLDMFSDQFIEDSIPFYSDDMEIYNLTSCEFDDADEFISAFGFEEYKRFVKENPSVFDLDSCLEDVKSSDGRGPSLAVYDGEEIVQGTYFLYKVGN